MKWHKIDLLKNAVECSPPTQKKPKTKALIYTSIFFAVALLLYSTNVTGTQKEGFLSSLHTLSPINLLRTLTILTGNSSKLLQGEEEDRINVLLIGMGGKNHDGGYLADTLMIGSFSPSTNQASLISIPRDLVIPIPGYGWRKINNLNAFAESKDENGSEYTKQIMSELFNIPIHYYVRIDFEGFERLIDAVDGISLYVDQTLDDPQYPIEGKEDAEPVEDRYEHLVIQKGAQEMDGSLALKYARSRHATGMEGSDFARAKRQQNVLEALKEKVLSLGTFTSPSRISAILGALNEHVATNFEIWEMIKLYKIARSVDSQSIERVVFDDSPNGLLTSAMYSGAFVLEPKSGDFGELREVIQNIFAQRDTTTPITFEKDIPVAHAQPIPTQNEMVLQIGDENASVEVQNGTLITGLARTTADDLTKLGITVLGYGNADEQDNLLGYLYDFSNGAYPKTEIFLHEKFGYKTEKGPLGPEDKRSTNADFLIILGP